MTSWIDLVGRARGMSTEMLGRDRLRALAECEDLRAVAAMLREADYSIPVAIEHDPRRLERQTRRLAEERLRVLARWADRRMPLLGPLMEDEDRRSLHAIFRGVLAGVPVESRTSGLVPTPAFSDPALEELASQASVRAVASLLVAWGTPYGSATLREADRLAPDLFNLQNAVDRAYFANATRVARRSGEPLRRHIRFLIDLENAWTALAGAAGELGRASESLFIEGGETVSLERFMQMIDAGAPSRARAALSEGANDPLLCRALTTRQPWWNAEDAALAALLDFYRQSARTRPLAAETVIHYALRLRAEVRDLARVIWGVQLGVPREQLVAELVTS